MHDVIITQQNMYNIIINKQLAKLVTHKFKLPWPNNN